MTQVDKSSYVTITHGMRGYFAVLMSWDEDIGFHTPWSSGFGSGSHPSDVEAEARRWAEDEECRLVLPDYDALVASVARSAAMSRRLAELRQGGMDIREAWRTMRAEFPL